MKEIWRDVKGYENAYTVSDQGKVKRLGRRRKPSGKYKRAILLRATKSQDGRLIVNLYQGSRRRKFVVSKLVANAFLPNPQGFRYTRHKDGNKKNNWLYNLEWYKTAHPMKKQQIESKKRKKLTEEERSKLPGFHWPEPYYHSTGGIRNDW